MRPDHPAVARSEPERGRPTPGARRVERASARALAAVLLASTSGACARACRDDRPVVDVEVAVAVASPFSIEAERAEARLADHLERVPGYEARPAGPSETGWQLRAEVRLASERQADEDPALRRRALGLGVELLRLGDGPGPGRHAAEALEVRVQAPEASPRPLIEAAMETVMGRLEVAVRLSEADPATLREALAGDDAHARAVALEVVRTRRLGALRPEVEARLAHPDTGPREAMRLVGALEALGDPAAASAMIDAVSRFPELTVPVLFTLGRLGGAEAEGYLLTVAAGHPDPRVRAAAHEAAGGGSTEP